MTNKYFKKLKIGLVSALMLFTTLAKGQAFTEDFGSYAALTGLGWYFQNNSQPLGGTNWYQGVTTVFNAYNGPANSYMAANYNNTSNVGTISNWAVMPNVTLHNGDVISFWTRCAGSTYPDRLELRMSTNGASTNVGTLATDLGDFTTLLLSVNPTLAVNGYPATWTQFSATISGLPGPTSGRFALRYFVTNGGPNGANSDYIGIDHVDYVPNPCGTITLTPASLPNGTAGLPYNQSFTQSGGVNPVAYSISAGSLPPGLTLSAGGTISGTPTATGTFNFTVSMTDNNGCPGTQSFSITIDCNPNGATVSFAPVCSNAGIITLTGGSPAGGTYSGTGVTANTFDPTVGTQTITYDVVDAYGCAQTTSAIQTVNQSPNVTLAPFAAICASSGIQTLSGGLPLGGTYTGIDVSGGMFDPVDGSQTITYTYTDANTCTDSASQLFSVVQPPIVIVAEFPELCTNGAPVTLYGGVPQGGVFSGPGVSGGVFTPTTAGTFPIDYTYSIGQCSGTTTQFMTVHSSSANTSLAGATGTTETQFTTDILAATEVRYVPDCDLMAWISPTGASPLSGNFTVSVTMDDAVKTYNGDPYVQRHYNVESLGFPGTATATITLYAKQSEFDAYNAYAAGKGYPLLPTGGVDNGKVRITQFHGTDTQPDDYQGSGILITPTVTWDGTNNWWVMTFPVVGLSGFFIHTTNQGPLSVANTANTNGSLEAYPNPVTDKVNIKVNGARNSNSSLSVTDLTGRVLITVPMDNDKAIVDMSSLAPGIYMIIYSDEERREMLKITKK